MSRLFDKKFGPDFLTRLPNGPAVYIFKDANNLPIYIGKAIRLRRRLSQYKNAKRLKRHKKMRNIVAEANSLEFLECKSHFEAILLEIRLIRKARPKFNVVGAFSDRYPVIGIRAHEKEFMIIYTTSPDEFSEYRLFGTFRSRFHTKYGFYAIADILSHFGHEEKMKREEYTNVPRYSRIKKFRQLDSKAKALLELFLSGESTALLESFILKAVESSSARRNSEQLQETIEIARRFFKFESSRLLNAKKKLKISTAFIPQDQRDELMAKYRYRNEENALGSP